MTSSNPEIAVLQTEMREANNSLSEIKGDIKLIKDALAEKYATKQELKSLKYLALPLTIVITAVITGLVYFYLNHGNTLAENTPSVTNNQTSTTPGSSGAVGSGTPSSNTSTTNNTTPQSTPSSQSSGGLLSVPKVQVGN